MNEKLNLVEILKDVPKGTMLWSYICGDCYFKKIKQGSCTPIICMAKTDSGESHTICFTKEGKHNVGFENGECVLFPSKENKNWSTFKVQKKHKEFKTYQKVLRMDNNHPGSTIWTADFYSHYEEATGKHYLTGGYIMDDDEIIPYEGNEDKAGKKYMKRSIINNNGYDYVNLGLPSGTLWATMNVGANKPSDVGLYFQWGNIVGYMANEVGKDKQFNWSDYKWYLSGNDYDNNVKFTKYTTIGTTLDLEDDAAHVNMSGDWHMPTPKQIEELIDYTTSAWETLDGVKGMTFTSNKDESKSIFIPVVGGAWSGSVHGSGRYGLIWSSMLDVGSVSRGKCLLFDSEGANLGDGARYCGFSVRGVIG